MRLAIAEDSGLFRSSLKLLLEASGSQVTASTASGKELLAAIRDNPPDVAILDIRMPPTFTDEGISTAAELRRLYPRIGILVLSTYAETSYASQLLEAVSTGVGYLLKDNVTDASALMDSLASVAAGETVIDPSIVRRLLQRNRKPSKIDTLNERERAVLRHMAEGRSNLGIAKELFLSARTVETHVTSIFTKLGLDQAETDNNRVRAVLAFLRSADSADLGAGGEAADPRSGPGLASSPAHLSVMTSLSPKALARSSPSRWTSKAAMTSLVPLVPACPLVSPCSSPWSAGGESFSIVTQTRTASPCLSRVTVAAVAHGMVFRASRIASTI